MKRYLAVPVILLSSWMVLAPAYVQDDLRMRDSECTVARVAERYLAVHFPHFDSVRSPPKILDKGKVWEVYYELPARSLGGTPIIIIDKVTLKVIEAYHS